MHELTELIRQDMCPALGVTEPGAIEAAAETGLPVCLMHMQGIIEREKLPIRIVHIVEILASQL